MRVTTKVVYGTIFTLMCSIQRARIKTVVDSLCTLSKESLHVMNAGKGETLYLSESLGRSRRVRNFSPLNLWRKDTSDYVSATGICGWHPVISFLFYFSLFLVALFLVGLSPYGIEYLSTLLIFSFLFGNGVKCKGIVAVE